MSRRPPRTWAGGRRPAILDANVRRRLVAATQRGLTLEDAARYAGISRRALMEWRAKGRELLEWAPSDWRDLRVDGLRKLADELGIPESAMRRGGRGGRVLRADLVRAIQEQAWVYVELLEDLEVARSQAKALYADVGQSVALGGRLQVQPDGSMDIVPRRLRRVRVRRAGGAPDGSGDDGPVIEVVEEYREVEPSETMLRYLMSRRWPEDFGRRRETDVAGAEEATQEDARRFVAMLREARESVPDLPEE